MPVLLPVYFFELGLDEHATESDIKSAYASRLKRIDRAADPEGFQTLRRHYEAAIAHVREGRGFINLEDLTLASVDEESDFAGDEAPAPESEAEVASASESDSGSEREPPADSPGPQSSHAGDEERPDIAPPPSPEPSAAPSIDVEPDAKPTASPRPAVERLIHPDDAARKVFDDLAEEITALNLQDLNGAQRLLSGALAHPLLASLSASEAFQGLVTEALLDRRCGRHSALLFFAATEVFRWHHGGQLSHRLSQAQQWTMQRWIDAAAALGAGERSSWLWLSEAPRVGLLNYVGAGAEFDWTSPLEEVCCEPEERNHWRALWRFQAESLHTLPEAPATASRSVGWRAWLRWFASRDAWMVAVPLMVFALVIVPLGRWGQHRQINARELACQNTLAAAQRVGWHGVDVQDVDNLKNCAAEFPPPRCDDREQLRRLVAISEVLRQSSNGAAQRTSFYYLLGMRAALDPGDGTLLGVKSDACGTGFASLMESGGWLRLGHVPTAEAITAQAARCVMAAHSKPADRALREDDPWTRDTWVIKLLSRTDAWQKAQHPSGLEGAPPPEVKLSSLVSTDPSLQTRTEFANEKKWPSCTNGPSPATTTPRSSDGASAPGA